MFNSLGLNKVDDEDEEVAVNAKDLYIMSYT